MSRLFHFIFIFLLLGSTGLVYLLLHGFDAELTKNREQIARESFTQVKAMSPQTLANNSKMINENVVAIVSQTQVAAKNTAGTFLHYQGKDYWCKEGPAQIDVFKATCKYSRSCFHCEGSQVIATEKHMDDEVIPFCSGGDNAETIPIECCPSGIDEHHAVVCPQAGECMADDSVTQAGCECGKKNGRCFWKNLDSKKVDCVCDLPTQDEPQVTEDPDAN